MWQITKTHTSISFDASDISDTRVRQCLVWVDIVTYVSSKFQSKNANPQSQFSFFNPSLSCQLSTLYSNSAISSY